MEYIYAALLLHKLGKPVDESGIAKVIASTGAEVDESKAKLLASSLKGVDIDKELERATAIAAAPAAGASESKAEEKKEEKEERSAAAEGLSSLFG